MGEPLNEQKWVRVMCEYGMDGIWDRDGYPRGPDELPVSEQTRRLLEAWQTWYDYDNAEDGPRIDMEAHAAFGLFIARLIKAQLPDWTIIYFDDGKHESALRRHAHRREFEYEVTLDDAKRALGTS